MNAELRGLAALPTPFHYADNGKGEPLFTANQVQAAIQAALSVAQGQGFVMVPGAYVDPRGKPVLTNEGDNITPAILARRGLRPVYELTETREPDRPIPENCRHDWATDGMGDYCRYCKKREDSYTPPAQAAEAVDANVEAVRAKLLARSRIGLAKYGVTTERDDLTLIDWITHAQEELMDATVYLEAARAAIAAMQAGEDNT